MDAKPKYLWHGTNKPIKGGKLLPRKASDIGNIPENMKVAVYATDVRDEAIAMALLKSRGVSRGSLAFGKVHVQGIAYEGWPAQESIYLYKLSSETFKQNRKGSNQWISVVAVPYERVEKLSTKDHLKLIRKPTSEERAAYERKYKVKLKE